MPKSTAATKDSDIEFLKKPIATLATVLLFCLTLLGYLSHQSNSKTEQLESSKSELSRWRSLFSEAEINHDIVQRFKNEYETFDSLPILLKEPRVLWIETLEGITKELGLTELQYEIKAQETEASTEFSESFEYVDLKKSDMTISFNVAHEGDFFKFIAALKKANIGIYTPTACNIAKTDVKILEAFTTLKIECVFRWFTIIEPEVTEEIYY